MFCKEGKAGKNYQVRRIRSGVERRRSVVTNRDLNQHFLRPAAKELGFYWKGFGWHSLQREAVTALNALLSTSGDAGSPGTPRRK
jgi:hypothetical protein